MDKMCRYHTKAKKELGKIPRALFPLANLLLVPPTGALKRSFRFSLPGHREGKRTLRCEEPSPRTAQGPVSREESHGGAGPPVLPLYDLIWLYLDSFPHCMRGELYFVKEMTVALKLALLCLLECSACLCSACLLECS